MGAGQGLYLLFRKGITEKAKKELTSAGQVADGLDWTTA
jgi:hypothetical protein